MEDFLRVMVTIDTFRVKFPPAICQLLIPQLKANEVNEGKK